MSDKIHGRGTSTFGDIELWALRELCERQQKAMEWMFDISDKDRFTGIKFDHGYTIKFRSLKSGNYHSLIESTPLKAIENAMKAEEGAKHD